MGALPDFHDPGAAGPARGFVSVTQADMSQDHRWIVDAIEEGVAAIEEDGARLIHVPLWLLPDAVREGDVLRARREGDRVIVERDDAAREEALRRSREQTKARPNPRDPGGPIDL